MWDPDESEWHFSEKMVYTYKSIPISSGIKRDHDIHTIHLVKKIQKNGILEVYLPAGMNVHLVEQFDMQGKLLRTFDNTNAKNHIMLPVAGNSGKLYYFRFKSNKGVFTLD